MSTDQLIGLIVCAAIVVLAFWGMWRAWQKKLSAGAALTLPAVSVGSVRQSFENVYYVLTAHADAPLQRVLVPGLEYRGYAQLDVCEQGARLQVRGAEPVSLAPIHSVGRASSTLAKTVEPGGLLALVWGSDEQQFETTLRFTDLEQQELALALLAGTITEKGSAAC